MLAVDNRKLTALYGCHNDGRELRPVKILCDLMDVRGAAPANLALVSSIDD